MAEKRFVIGRVVPAVFLDKGGQAVTGFKIAVTLVDYDEVHYINVATTDPNEVKAAVADLLVWRDALAKM